MLRDCKAGDRFEGTVLVAEWKESPFRQKAGSFVTLTCQDKTGTMSAKIWEVQAELIGWLNQADVFYIQASVTEYKGLLDLNIDLIRPVPTEEVNIEELLPASPYSVEILEERTDSLLSLIQNPQLKCLLSRIINESEWREAYRKAPAALKVHQAYLRGLWEHSLGVAELALSISFQYPDVDRDLLITGSMLHDIGKIFEYSYERAFAFTTDGRLLGHIIMGVDLLSREISKIEGFSTDLRTKLLHIITSHHGRYEWQSPKRPKCIEAVIVHYADALEAELWQFNQAKKDNPTEEWSPYIRSLERNVYLGRGER
ncbi:MAG: HD domain-containing protein [Desulfitobacterium hafniense]|nr:HD domain-containing protein [Desulfitobacterium hafniense]